MAIEQGKLQLEKHQYDLFLKEYKNGTKYKSQRLGQAFYNHFNMHKLANQKQLNGLYELDGDIAKQCIATVFRFN